MDVLVLTPRPDDLGPLAAEGGARGVRFHVLPPDVNFYPLVRDRGVRVVILDVLADDRGGPALVRDIKAFDPSIDVLYVGPEAPVTQLVALIKAGVTEYLARPLDLRGAWTVLERIRDKARVRRETHTLEAELAGKYCFQGLVGKSAFMLEIFALIEKIARYSSPILVTGETGTGKEMAACAVHELGPRRGRVFLTCNCAAIPETLFESELFGHARGAFTGADRARRGLFEQAHGGTLFLDEIGEVPLAVQTKLLRAVEERRFRPLGSERTVESDVHIISATNRDLRALVREGLFREDLFQRLSVLEIVMPPLRDRKEDIPLLCRHFLGRANRKYGRRVGGLSLRAQKAFQTYPWPGNVRELQNLIERGVMLTSETFLDLKDFPAHVASATAGPEETAAPAAYPFRDLTLAEVERRHILEVLDAVSQNRVQAAGRLGLTRPALYRKLKRLSIARPKEFSKVTASSRNDSGH